HSAICTRDSPICSGHRASSCFFLKCSGDHRDLHSFPTRRSSDLRLAADPGRGEAGAAGGAQRHEPAPQALDDPPARELAEPVREDRKSTRLNSSHVKISYAVFCLKKKKQKQHASHAATHTQRGCP